MRVINRLANEGPNFNEHELMVVTGPATEKGLGLIEVSIESSESEAYTVTVNGNQLIKAVQNAMNW